MPGYPCKRCCSSDPPPPAECCLCEPAWEISGWSVSLFGKEMSGAFPEAPDPIPPEECDSRLSSFCEIEPEEIIADCIVAGAWSSPEGINMIIPCPPGYGCTGDVNVKSWAFLCMQCICYLSDEEGPVDTPCGEQSTTVYESSFRGVDHWRVWQQERWHSSAAIICCDDGKVKFRVAARYSLTRFGATQSAVFRRYREVTVVCNWESPSGGTLPTYIYGDWVEPATTTTHPPCKPCDWSDSEIDEEFTDCELDSESDCGPPEAVTQSVTLHWEVFRDNVGGPIQTGGVDCDLAKITGSTEIAVYSGTRGCGAGIATIGTEDCEFGAGTTAIEATWESECFDCDDLPCSATLHRIDGPTSDETVWLAEEVVCDGCTTIPGKNKTIPYAISLTLCEEE